MINQFGPESHGGHFGVEKAQDPDDGPKKRQEGCMRVLKQKHRSAHPGADRGGMVRRGRGQQRISCKLLKLLTQGKPAS